MFESLNEKVLEVIKPILDEEEIVLVGLSIRRQGQDMYLQILADRHTGGITIDECSSLNKRIGDALTTRDLIPTHYILEVSSPGLDRPLKTMQDFLRTMGREVRFFLSEPVENKIEYVGIIKRVEGDVVTIESHLQSRLIEIDLPLNKINKAKQVIRVT